ncbi:MAG: hypothetical protein IPK87_03630 [Planctomycetes bacterium]|nr:hypothetical protein [Planctomycetota bacterium]
MARFQKVGNRNRDDKRFRDTLRREDHFKQAYEALLAESDIARIEAEIRDCEQVKRMWRKEANAREKILDGGDVDRTRWQVSPMALQRANMRQQSLILQRQRVQKLLLQQAEEATQQRFPDPAKPTETRKQEPGAPATGNPATQAPAPENHSNAPP